MNGLVCPARRKLLKAVPFVAAAPFILKSGLAHSMLFHGGRNGALATAPVQPSLAISNGKNTNTFWDDFTSLSTIDVNNTLSAGYKWYSSYYYLGQHVILTSASYSINNSVLTLNPVPNNTPYAPNAGWLRNVGYPTTSTTVGTPIAATGGYFGCRLAMGQVAKPYAAAGSAFWLNDTKLSLDQAQQVNTSLPLGEIDIFEYGVTGVSSYDAAIHQWNTYNGTNASNSAGFSANSDVTNFHNYELVWLTMAQNSGTGKVTCYIDGTQVFQQTYTAGGNYSCLENSPLGFDILIGGAFPGFPVYVDWVQVWQ